MRAGRRTRRALCLACECAVLAACCCSAHTGLLSQHLHHPSKDMSAAQSNLSRMAAVISCLAVKFTRSPWEGYKGRPDRTLSASTLTSKKHGK